MVISFINCSRKFDRLTTFQSIALIIVYIESSLLSAALTVFGKYFAGRLRPNFLARIESPELIPGGKLSYPSGHTSFSFACSTSLSLFLSVQCSIYDAKSKNVLFKTIVFVIFPFMIASLVAISRTRDYYHDFSDINAGAIIGILSGILGYNSVFPSITHDKKKIPRYLINIYRKPLFADAETTLCSENTG